ncbi:MAG: Na+/H+ antiporter NhaA [Myxococcaceae bacterium]|nr:Na+/H+ antiporter NhaA [Myxococcaceae bacterium]
MTSDRPPEALAPLVQLARLAARPIDRFLHIQAASGLVLLVCAAVAMGLANSPWRDAWFSLWESPIGLRVGSFAVEKSLAWVVNDGLMVIFFFVVGLEIRREAHQGELSTWRRAALPAAAALGGMLVPAVVYLAIAGAPETRAGWGVPMATDIAFAVGILALLGPRAPPALRVLLLALAVIDDLGAIVVIALFYTSELSWSFALVAALGFAGIFAFQAFGVRSKWAYVVPAVVAWAGVYGFGVHPTIAGVLVGLVTPVRAWLGPEGFVAHVQRQLGAVTTPGLSAHELAVHLAAVDHARREALSPAESLIEKLHPVVAWGIMPVFALANAGVALDSGPTSSASSLVTVGVIAGLVVGKPVGVFAASWLVTRLGVGTLPIGLGGRHLVVLGLVAGVGFTMSLFTAQLAFVDAALLGAAKVGVLVASVVAATLSVGAGLWLLPKAPVEGAAMTAHEAEGSTTK